jgi:hypothetical protein
MKLITRQAKARAQNVLKRAKLCDPALEIQVRDWIPCRVRERPV